MNKKEDVKIAGVVTLYNPTDDDINNINTYIDDIERLYKLPVLASIPIYGTETQKKKKKGGRK